MAAQVTKHKARIKDLIAYLQSTEMEITWAGEELREERHQCISIEDSFATTLEEVVSKKVVEAMKLAHIQAKEERESH